MPRSVVRPNQATKHMAVLLTVREMGMTDLTPTKTNKIPAATLQYLYGYFDLPYTTKPNVDTLISTLNIPSQFILNIRIIEQYHDGKPLPAKYNYDEALEGYRDWLSHVRGDDEIVDPDGEEEVPVDEGNMDLEEYDHHYEAVTSDEPIPVPDGVSPESWGYAQRFIQALRLEGGFADVGCHPDLDQGSDDEEVFDHHGTWEYPDTEGYEDDEYGEE